MELAIKIQRVSVKRGGQQILKDMSIDLPAGGIIGLLGPNGAGKTTLIRAIVGRQHIHRGSIDVFGLPAGSPKLRKDIGYMTQALSIYPDLTVRENMQFFAAMTGQPKSQASQVMQHVELTGEADTLVAQLSGGQKSRVSLAIALLGRPKLLVLDEPTVGLDPVLRQRLWKLFRQLADQGCTLLVSSHVMDEADHCDQLLLIRNGTVLAYGTPKELGARTHTKSIEESFIALVGGAA